MVIGLFLYQVVYIIYFSLLLVPLCLFFYVVLWKKSIIHQMGNPVLIKTLLISYSPNAFLIKFFFVFSALCLLAFLGYNLNKIPNNVVPANGADIVIAIDVSNSMLCTDVKPSRLIKAKSFANKLIQNPGNNRFGIIVFAGKALLQMPITTDTNETKDIVNNISTLSVLISGTNMGAALQLANGSLNTKERRSKKIILISDGEAHDSLALSISKKLLNDEISVYTVGVGTSKGGQIIIDSSLSYLNDKEGKIVITKLNESLLKDIAKITKGQYYALDNANVVAENILSNIDKSYFVNANSKSKNNDRRLVTLVLFAVLFLVITEIFISEANKNIN